MPQTLDFENLAIIDECHNQYKQATVVGPVRPLSRGDKPAFHDSAIDTDTDEDPCRHDVRHARFPTVIPVAS